MCSVRQKEIDKKRVTERGRKKEIKKEEERSEERVCDAERRTQGEEKEREGDREMPTAQARKWRC